MNNRALLLSVRSLSTLVEYHKRYMAKSPLHIHQLEDIAKAVSEAERLINEFKS